ncbi:hypothetical protein WCP94_000124 (plasmid) [Bilophila wadsworthia]
MPQAGSCGNLGFSRRKRDKASLKTSFFASDSFESQQIVDL